MIYFVGHGVLLDKQAAVVMSSNVCETLRAAVRREFLQTPPYGAARSAGHETGSDYLYERRVLERDAPQPTPAPAPVAAPVPAPAPQHVTTP